MHTVCIKFSVLKSPWKNSKNSKVKDREEQNKAKAGFSASIAFKCNLKMGGTNYLLGNSSLVLPKEDSILIIGIHLAEPGNRNDTSETSLVGIVSNTDQKFTQWPGAIRSQDKADTVRGIYGLIKERVKLFAKKDKKSPTKVIVYRRVEQSDGYQTVFHQEIPEMRRALNACDSERPPQLTVVAVSPSGGRFGTKMNGKAKDKDGSEVHESLKVTKEPKSHQGKNERVSIVKPSDYNP